MLKPTRLGIWPTLPPNAYRRERLTALPFPLEDPRHRVFSRARQGLFHGVRELGLSPGDTVLVPSYHHGSEVEALQRAGLICRFYDLEADLQPGEDRLETLLGPEVRALYLIHYFGIPQPADRWRAWCDQRGLALIEDAAMAFLSSVDTRPVGSFGDLAIFCLYKSFALPDGGATICSASMPYPRSKRSLGLVQGVIRNGSWLAQRSRAAATVHAMIGGDRDPRWGHDFDLGDVGTPPSRVTLALIPRLIDPGAAARRRSNHKVLVDELGERVQPLFPTVPDGAAPIAFLFRCEPEAQRSLRRALADRGVMLANFWMAAHPSVPVEGFDRSRRLRSCAVGLPVHQELRDIDVERVVTAARTALRVSA